MILCHGSLKKNKRKGVTSGGCLSAHRKAVQKVGDEGELEWVDADSEEHGTE